MDIFALVKSAFALFAIVDPVGVIPIFLVATQGYTLVQSRAAARIAALTVLGVLTPFTFAGEPLLMFFGIRLAAFSRDGIKNPRRSQKMRGPAGALRRLQRDSG